MARLESLSSFLTLCQISGLLPFCMEINPETRRFERFTFSYFHPLILWYAFNKIINAVYFSRIIYRYMEISLYAANYLLFSGFYLVFFILPFLCYRIRNAIKSINRFDETLEDLPNKPLFNVPCRTFLCAVFGLIPVK